MRLALAWLVCSLLASFQGPMTTLVSSYPYGEQLSLEVSPDRGVVFVAEGAAITVLDATVVAPGNPPPTLPVIEKIPMPECQPLALAFSDPPPQRHAS